MSYTTNWSVSTYASADNVQFGHWYSQRNPKLDGMTIGTVMSIQIYLMLLAQHMVALQQNL